MSSVSVSSYGRPGRSRYSGYSSYGYGYPSRLGSWYNYGRSSGLGSLVKLALVGVALRGVYLYMTAGAFFPWHWWARSIFFVLVLAKLAMTMLEPVAPHELRRMIWMYDHHVNWIVWTSGGITLFTMIHALASFLSRLFCAVCGGTIQGISCGLIDGFIFSMACMLYYEIRGVHWAARQRGQLQTALWTGCFAVFIAGNAFYHSQRGFTVLASTVLIISGIVATYSLWQWKIMAEQLTEVRGRPGYPGSSASAAGWGGAGGGWNWPNWGGWGSGWGYSGWGNWGNWGSWGRWPMAAFGGSWFGHQYPSYRSGRSVSRGSSVRSRSRSYSRGPAGSMYGSEYAPSEPHGYAASVIPPASIAGYTKAPSGSWFGRRRRGLVSSHGAHRDPVVGGSVIPQRVPTPPIASEMDYRY